MSMSRDYRQMYNDEHFEPHPRDKEIVESELGQNQTSDPQTEQPLARLISDQSAKSGKSAKSEKTVKTEFAFFSSSDDDQISDEDIDEGKLRIFLFA